MTPARAAAVFRRIAPWTGALAVVAACETVRGPVGERALEHRLRAAVETATGLSLEVGSIELAHGPSVTAKRVVFRERDGTAAASIDRVVVALDPEALLRGRLRLRSVVDGARGDAIRLAAPLRHRSAHAPRRSPPVPGPLEIDLRMRGADLRAGAAPPVEGVDLALTLRLRPGHASVTTVARGRVDDPVTVIARVEREGDGRWSIAGRVDLAPRGRIAVDGVWPPSHARPLVGTARGLAWALPPGRGSAIPAPLRRGRADADLRVEDRSRARLRGVLRFPNRVRLAFAGGRRGDRVYGTIDASGAAGAIASAAATAELSPGRLRPRTAVVVGDLDPGQAARAGLLSPSLAARFRGGERVSAVVRADGDRVLARATLAGARLPLVEAPPLRLEIGSATAVVSLHGRDLRGSIRSDARHTLLVSARGAAWRANGTIVPALAPALEALESAAGVEVAPAASFAVDGTAPRPSAWTFAHGAGATLAASAQVGPSNVTSRGRWRTAPLSAAIAVDGVDIAGLVPAAGDLREIHGTLDARGLVEGSIDEPVPSIRVTLRDGGVVSRAVGRIDGLHVEGSVGRAAVRVTRVRARGGRGDLFLTGDARATGDGWSLLGRLRARRFALAGERFSGEIDAAASFRGRMRGRRVEATFDLEEGRLRLPSRRRKAVQPLAPHPEIVVLVADEERAKVRGADAPSRPVDVHLRVRAPGNVRLEARDLDLEAKGSLAIDVGPGPVRLTGTVESIAGTATPMGRRFRLEEATLTFADDRPREGEIFARAVHEIEGTPRTTIEARVRGPIRQPELDLRSDPPLPETAIASLLLLGETGTEPGFEADGPTGAGRAATVLGSALTGELRRRLQRTIPVDVLALEPGDATAEGRLRVGKRLWNGLVLTYAHAFGAVEEDGVNVLRLEYRFHRVWQLVTELTDGNRGTVDVVWTREH